MPAPDYKKTFRHRLESEDDIAKIITDFVVAVLRYIVKDVEKNATTKKIQIKNLLDSKYPELRAHIYNSFTQSDNFFNFINKMRAEPYGMLPSDFRGYKFYKPEFDEAKSILNPKLTTGVLKKISQSFDKVNVEEVIPADPLTTHRSWKRLLHRRYSSNSSFSSQGSVHEFSEVDLLEGAQSTRGCTKH